MVSQLKNVFREQRGNWPYDLPATCPAPPDKVRTPSRKGKMQWKTEYDAPGVRFVLQNTAGPVVFTFRLVKGVFPNV